MGPKTDYSQFSNNFRPAGNRWCGSSSRLQCGCKCTTEQRVMSNSLMGDIVFYMCDTPTWIWTKHSGIGKAQLRWQVLLADWCWQCQQQWWKRWHSCHLNNVVQFIMVHKLWFHLNSTLVNPRNKKKSFSYTNLASDWCRWSFAIGSGQWRWSCGTKPGWNSTRKAYWRSAIDSCSQIPHNPMGMQLFHLHFIL